MRVVLLGDSHLARVRRDLPRIGTDVLNAAVGGSVATDVARQAAGAGLADGDVAVLSIGTNDDLRGVPVDMVFEAIAALAATFAPATWVYVVPPLARSAAHADAVIAALPPVVVDSPALLAPLGPRATDVDGVHLTGAAYAVLLPAIAAAVRAG